ncbi:restriction endonuclease subunit S [Mycoplasma sp. 4404]|uniref:restriction endonuclease subunit S n=1 Tax=Mycoplasma sp. 4404 TaxID=3108530 RepID=UPI002B1E6762|nr:restriction endonuclease subunit S [Mycoplasma sp. 4404]MEA4162715.1 restriction endonuclease subunit S [Mycoplasma sp. 4404]
MKLKNMVNIINGSTPSTSNPEFWDGDIKWITPKDMSSLKTRYISYGNRNITELGYSSCSTTLVPKGTVLLTSRAPIGYVAIAENSLCTNQGFKSMICNENLVKPTYLYYWLLKNREYLNSIAGGSTFKELSKEQLGNVDIELPNLEIQQHIVNTIGTVDNLIEKIEEKINFLKIMSTNLYSQNSEYPCIQNLSLADVCLIKTGKINANEADKTGSFPFFTCGTNELLINDYAFDCEAIIIAGNGEISVKHYKGKFNAYQRTYVLEPQKYFYLFLKECENNINVLKNNSQGSVIKFITKPMLEKISINLNNHSEEINEKTGQIYNLILNYRNQISLLIKIKDILLSKYF